MDTWPISGFQIDEEVTLRRFTPSDAEQVYGVVRQNVDHLLEFMHWMTPEYSLEMSREFIERSARAVENRESLGFAITRNGNFIGSIGYASFDWKARKTEIGYWIDRSEQGKGVISKAAKLLIEHAFGDLGLNRIEIRCAAENVRSAAIPKRFGFKLEAHLRQAEFRNGKLHDFLTFGLLRDEWKQENK